MKKILLEKIKFNNEATIAENEICELSGTEWYNYIEFMKHNLVFGIRGYIWGQHKTLDTARWPMDWWEAFKERWFPKLLLKYFPIIYTEKHYDAYAMFPTLKLDMPDHYAIVYLNESQEDANAETKKP